VLSERALLCMTAHRPRQPANPTIILNPPTPTVTPTLLADDNDDSNDSNDSNVDDATAKALIEKTQAGLDQKKAELAALLEQLEGLKALAQ
jgi:hypothetical protein